MNAREIGAWVAAAGGLMTAGGSVVKENNQHQVAEHQLGLAGDTIELCQETIHRLMNALHSPPPGVRPDRPASRTAVIPGGGTDLPVDSEQGDNE